MDPTGRGDRRQASVGILASCRAEIIQGVLRELRDQENRIVLEREPRQSFLEHVSACLDGVLRDLRADASLRAPRRPEVSHPLSLDIGQARAAQGIHPGESITASLVLFKVAAATFLTALAREAPDTAAEVTPAVIAALHRNVIERVVTATVRYMEYLLDRIQAAHVEERHRVSREVHDRVANEVAAAYRRLEICAGSGEMPGPEVRQSVQAARSALTDALSAIREISARLQVAPPHRSLQAALTGQLAVASPPGPRTRVLVVGDEHLVPPRIRGEILLILAEAIRNTVTHAQARSLDVQVDISARQVACVVADDGIGSGPPAPHGEPGHLGLLSMRERTESLGGVFTAISSPGEGTRINVLVPLSA